MLDDQYDYFDIGGGGGLTPQAESPFNQWGIPPNGGNPAGYMDLSYWISRGVNPDQIFDQTTGQTKPGWSRTANGYERTGVTRSDPVPNPDPVWPPGGGGGGGGGGFGLLTEPYTGKPPAWMFGPTFQPPTFTPPPAFSYKEFQAPTQESIYADPSYQFRKGEGEKSLAQRIASTGAYRTGGTLKDFINYNQNAASQEYGNIFKRAVDTHNLGLQQALGTYGTNYGVSRDVFDRLYEGNKATFAGQQRENELMNQRNFDNFLADFDIFERNRKRVGDYLLEGVRLGD